MSHGWVYYQGQRRPFREWRKARSHLGVERVAVKLRVYGKDEEVIISKEAVKRFPEEEKSEVEIQ